MSMNTVSRQELRTLVLLVAGLALGGCTGRDSDASAQVAACTTTPAIEGEYKCAGECVVKGAGGNSTLVPVSGETDLIERFPGAKEALYQVSVTGSNDFHELEIGALVGCTLRTATADVSDAQFPVLEEYVFENGPDGKARSFTKIVHNPSAEHFKACAIRCERSRP